MARQTAAEPRLEPAGLEVDVVVHDEHVLRRRPCRTPPPPGSTHPTRSCTSRASAARASRHATRTSASRPRNFPLNEPSWRRASSSTTIQPTLCRSRACSRPGIAEPGDEKIERRAVLSPTEEAHDSLRVGLLVLAGGLGGLLALAGLALGGSPRPRPPQQPRPRRPPPRARSPRARSRRSRAPSRDRRGT